MLRIFKSLLEALYLYQQSFYYRIHFFLLISLTVFMLYLLKKESTIKKQLMAREQ